ncbi:hypothetical protein IGI04_034455 [Brassica rapa subsp. trilocularis]|uniref:FERM domain-containing protein n=1 Tax=Brassica rapa subsp. trilocularis TaxID=1813537 RepID=A0ABQ7LAS0_BRACM|nr:hypothetical protein IGI04_034455 [Brassica rapa subsp. trilocularis]
MCVLCLQRNVPASKLSFLYTGRLFLNGTFGTDIYFDTETDAEKEHYAKWLKPDSLFIKTDSCSEDRPLTVSELNQSVLTADPQIIEFLCTAKVIQSEKGGVILAAVDVLRRYHVELSAADQTDDALFVAFDMEMLKLTNIQT